jgi:hypothetical protein
VKAGCLAITLLLEGCPTTTPGEPEPTPSSCDVPDLSEVHAAGPPITVPWPDAPDCAADPLDTIIVLGCPTNDDGTLSSCQAGRVERAMRFYDAGVAASFIPSGAAVQNEWIEAESIRDALLDHGVPAAAITVEPRAEHTDENLYFATRLMEEREWRRALVVSDPIHLLGSASCDANCCVALGRLTLVQMPGFADLDDGKAAFYELLPDAAPVTDAECAYLVDETALCGNLDDRRACRDDFQLDR